MGRPRLTAVDRPLPGRRPLDGSRQLARLMRAGKIDRRTAPAKASEKVIAVLTVDWGGPDAMPGAAKILTDRLGPLTVRMILRERRLMREAAAGIDDPTSDKHTIGLLNALSRSLARLEEMRARDSGQQHNGGGGTPCDDCSARFYGKDALQDYLQHRKHCHAPPAAAPAAPAAAATVPEVPAAPADAAEATQSSEGSE